MCLFNYICWAWHKENIKTNSSIHTTEGYWCRVLSLSPVNTKRILWYIFCMQCLPSISNTWLTVLLLNNSFSSSECAFETYSYIKSTYLILLTLPHVWINSHRFIFRNGRVLLLYWSNDQKIYSLIFQSYSYLKRMWIVLYTFWLTTYRLQN